MLFQMVIIVWDIAATLTLCWVTKASERIQMVWQVRDMIDTPFDQKNWFLFVFAGFSSLSYLSAHNNKKDALNPFTFSIVFKRLTRATAQQALSIGGHFNINHIPEIKHLSSSLCVSCSKTNSLPNFGSNGHSKFINLQNL